MNFCSQCGAQFPQSGNFCSVCGTPPLPMYPQQQPNPQPVRNAKQDFQPQYGQPQSPPANNPHHMMARGFAQMFGLHPAAALLTVIVNTMIFGAAGVAGLISLPTAGASLVALTAISTICGCILGIITYMAQKKWYADDKESAVIKALIVGFLTAIPVGLPGYLVIPSGIIGFFRRKD
jgi:hypothetical protein